MISINGEMIYSLKTFESDLARLAATFGTGGWRGISKIYAGPIGWRPERGAGQAVPRAFVPSLAHAECCRYVYNSSLNSPVLLSSTLQFLALLSTELLDRYLVTG